MTDVERYHWHLGECEECGSPQEGMCVEGVELLFECVEDLGEQEQAVARRIRDREQLKREADANFEYYSRCEEP